MPQPYEVIEDKGNRGQCGRSRGFATQQALLGNDYSVTNVFTVITTLIDIEIGLSLVSRKVKTLDKWNTNYYS